MHRWLVYYYLTTSTRTQVYNWSPPNAVTPAEPNKKKHDWTLVQSNKQTKKNGKKKKRPSRESSQNDAMEKKKEIPRETICKGT